MNIEFETVKRVLSLSNCSPYFWPILISFPIIRVYWH